MQNILHLAWNIGGEENIYGFFHADPHPANLLIMENDKLALIDWGMVGRLTETDRFELIGIPKSVIEKDSSTLINDLLNITKGKKSIDFKTMERDLLDILDSYHAIPIKDLNIGHLLMAIMTLLQDYQLKLPTDFVIMIKDKLYSDEISQISRLKVVG
jgi:ubiquinone biosynthesis protein